MWYLFQVYFGFPIRVFFKVGQSLFVGVWTEGVTSEQIVKPPEANNVYDLWALNKLDLIDDIRESASVTFYSVTFFNSKFTVQPSVCVRVCACWMP